MPSIRTAGVIGSKSAFAASGSQEEWMRFLFRFFRLGGNGGFCASEAVGARGGLQRVAGGASGADVAMMVARFAAYARMSGFLSFQWRNVTKES